MKLLRAFLVIIIGLLIIPILFAISIILMITLLLEKIFTGTDYSIRIARYVGDDSTELLKTISGSDQNS